MFDCLFNLNQRFQNEQNLSSQKKVESEESLDNINSRLKEKRSIRDFIINNIDDDLDSSGTIKESVNTFCSFFEIKIIGTKIPTKYKVKKIRNYRIDEHCSKGNICFF